MSENFKHTKNMIEWRRNTVLSKLAKGWSQAEIAKELQLHPSTISLDVQFLKEQAQRDLQTHVQERLPLEYARAMTGMNNVLKRASEILDQATDNKVKLEAMKLLMDLYKSVMSLATNGGIVERAMKIVKGLEREDISKIKMSSGKGEDEEDLEDEEDIEDEEITVNDEDEILKEEEEELPKEQ
jgi:Ran GTPase-activating protein (RanGAP) involved in mRNA processing and transport